GEARQAIAQGRNPFDESAAAKTSDRTDGSADVLTFGAFAEEYVDRIKSGFKNAKHRQQWKNSLVQHASAIWQIPISDVATDDVLAVLHNPDDSIWERVPETASRVRGRIERILDAAKAMGLREGENPARWRGHLDNLLPRRKRLARGHHRALVFDEAPEFMAALRHRPAMA